MGKKSRNNKDKKISLRTKEERIFDVDEIKHNFRETGLTDQIEDVQIFYDVLDQYIEDGISISGKIKLNGLKRIIEYILTNNKNKKLQVKLTYNKDI
jgi:hypothetical protein